MQANWHYSSSNWIKSGTGLTEICDVGHGYVGTYKITYYDQDGGNAGTFDLEIAEKNDRFRLTWKRNDEIVFVGIGMQTPDGLTAGWRKYIHE